MTRINIYLKDNRKWLEGIVDDNNCGLNASGTAFAFYPADCNKKVLTMVPWIDVKSVEYYDGAE